MTDPTTSTPPPLPKSTFVTVVAWIFIILSGFATLISLLQNMMVGFMPHDLFNTATQDPNFTAMMPSGARFMFAHLQLLVLLSFVVCLATLLSSIGLLRRRNWARLVFIGLLGVGIVYNIGAVFFQQSMMSSFPRSFPMDSVFAADSAFRQTSQQMAQMMETMKIVMIVFTVGFAALFAWIIAKLLSRPIREEFGSVERAA